MGFSGPINLERLSRIPARIRQDIETIRLVKNWREVLSAKLFGGSLQKINFRDGIVLESPPEVDLLFLFHEIWIDKIYDLKGYEIRKGYKIIDIGGNIGAFALYAAGREKDISIRAYEPFPENAEFFTKNVEVSNLEGIKVYQEAVAGAEGERVLQVDDSWVRHSLSENGAETGGIRVPATSLDSILEETRHCDLLKIDCEGGEYEIFYGAKPETLRMIDRIVCEYHDGPAGNGEELKKFFEANSFEVDTFRSFDETTGLLLLRNSR